MDVLVSLIKSVWVTKDDYLGANLLYLRYHWANELDPIYDYKVKTAMESLRIYFSSFQW